MLSVVVFERLLSWWEGPKQAITPQHLLLFLCYLNMAFILLLKFLFLKRTWKSFNNAHLLTFLWNVRLLWYILPLGLVLQVKISLYISSIVFFYFHDYFSISCIYPVFEFKGCVFRVTANGVDVRSAPWYSLTTPFHSSSLSATPSEVVSLLQLMNPRWHIMVTQSS